MASLVGAARALEEASLRPSVFSLCSGSALFGFPLAAGISTEEVAAFTLGLLPQDYVDLDWSRLLRLALTAGRGFAGIICGAAIEESYRRLLGDKTLGDMPVPAYAPIWNVEQNRVEFIGPRTHPELSVARAVRMAVALPLFIRPVELDGYHWCDGGIVDIFPVHPLLDIEQPCDVTLAINGFYPPEFQGRRRQGLGVSPSQHPVCRESGAHLSANRAGAGKPGPTARGIEGADDRAGLVPESAGRRFLPPIPQHPRMARIHASRAYRGTSRASGHTQPITCPVDHR